MSARNITATISISSNPATAHIGRYFTSVADTTGGANRQITTRIGNEEATLAFIAELTESATGARIAVNVIDETGELA